MREEKINNSVIIKKDNISITKDDSKCINCGLCKICCSKKVGVFPNKDCIECGQCIFSCPVRALNPKEEYTKVDKILKEHNKTLVALISPAVKVTIGEIFNIDNNIKLEGKLITSLKKLGFDYVFDTSLGADLTTMEETEELIDRLNTNKNLPLFTSCCPSYVKYIKDNHKELLDNISTCKSPIAMLSTIIKEYFSKLINVDKEDIIIVAITPCTSKKYEKTIYKETDYVVTVSELGKWIKEKNIDFINLKDSNYDDILKTASGAGIIFGSTGGVTLSVMRTLHYKLTGKDSKDLLEFKNLRDYDKIKTTKITINDKELNIAIIHTMPALEEFLKTEDYKKYHFIEVMNCPGGCIGGGGTPYVKQIKQEEINKKRIDALSNYDKTSKIRYPYKNKDLINIYDNFLNNDSSLKEKLLHTKEKIKE